MSQVGMHHILDKDFQQELYSAEFHIENRKPFRELMEHHILDIQIAVHLPVDREGSRN
jgi:hypothetical protein